MRPLLIFLIAFGLSCNLQAENYEAQNEEIILSPDNAPYFNLAFGFSPFTGVFGFEYQNENHVVGVGLPERVFYNYYFNPYGDSKFWGVYVGTYDYDEYDAQVNGRFFRQIDRKSVGAGVGYRWQWASGWNATAAIAIEYNDNEYSNPNSSIRYSEQVLSLFPGLTLGYKF